MIVLLYIFPLHSPKRTIGFVFCVGARMTAQYLLISTTLVCLVLSQACGQTIETVVVDLVKPPTGTLSGFNAYVALSQSRGRNTIRLLRDFDDKFFTIHPNEDLRKEDDKLRELEKETLSRYQLNDISEIQP